MAKCVFVSHSKTLFRVWTAAPPLPDYALVIADRVRGRKSRSAMIESARGRLVIIDWDALAKPSEIYSLYKKTHGIRAASIFHS
jgi:hypothetical protein